MSCSVAIEPQSSLRAVVLGAALCLGLSACGDPPAGTPHDGSTSLSASQSAPSTSLEESMHTDEPQQSLNAQQKLLEEHMPQIASALGSPRVKTLRQTTCTGQYDPAAMGDIVEWSASTGRSVKNLEEAQAVADEVKPYLTAHGWTVTPADGIRPEAPLNTLYTAEHAETRLEIQALYDHGGGESVVYIDASGPCVDMPKGNQMVRSHLDNGFGIPQAEYDWEAERRSPDYQEYSLPPGEQPGPSLTSPGH